MIPRAQRARNSKLSFLPGKFAVPKPESLRDASLSGVSNTWVVALACSLNEHHEERDRRAHRRFPLGANVHSIRTLDFPRAVRYRFFVNIFERVWTLQQGAANACSPGPHSRFSGRYSAVVPRGRTPSSPEFSAPPASFLPAFLPGSAQYVECDVTLSKQRTGDFLPGATTACQRARFQGNFHVENHAVKSKRQST
jgi:hypothetical protein